MFLQRNTASQVFTIPGSLRAIADGSAVTSGTISWIKDGTSSAGSGTLTHVSSGCFTYQPTQTETDAKICGFILTGTGAVPLAGSIRTTNSDPNDGTRLGLLTLPNANAGASGGLPLSADSSGRVDVLKINGTSQTARDIGASVLLSSGTGTGQIILTAGNVTVGSNNDKSNYSLSSSQTFNLTGNITGSLSGSVGNVSGNVTISSGSVDAVWAKTMTELSAVPGVTADVLSALTWVFELARNKVTQTSSTQSVYKDNGSTVLATATVSDDGSVFTRNEFN